jgi:hypothetical protein
VIHNGAHVGTGICFHHFTYGQQMQAAMPLRSGKRGSRRRQLVSSPSAAVAVEGRPCLHPTTKLPIPAVNTIHAFSGQSKLCFVRDRLSGKDFLGHPFPASAPVCRRGDRAEAAIREGPVD